MPFCPALPAGGGGQQKSCSTAISHPVALRFAIEQHGGEVLWGADPITFIKAHKNAVELAGYRESHRQDGAAWVNFRRLTHEVPAREAAGNPVTELEAQQKQLEFRQQQPGFIEQSFSTISASASNAAMCHYHSSEKTNLPITRAHLYLNDSGGQYQNGTTDATRTLSFGPVDAPQRLHYTAVLKGFLSMFTLQFPSGTHGHQLDAFARRALWDLGLDFDHGTGHGVGHQLLIHEQPQRIAKKVNPWPLSAGNIMTIEPGYYRPIATVFASKTGVEVVESQPGFCRFASLTLIPIDLSARSSGVCSVNKSSSGWMIIISRYATPCRRWSTARPARGCLPPPRHCAFRPGNAAINR